VLLVALMLYDLFESVVIPRPSPRLFRIGPLVIRLTWWFWHTLANRQLNTQRRENMLGSYAPFTLLGVLIIWVIGLAVGYGLILYALRTQIHPQPQDLGTALYFSSLSLLTLGFGDYVPVGPVARVLVLAEAATGLGTVALVISFLFSLYANFQRREALVITLDASAGAPPSGVALLENARRLGVERNMEQIYDDWMIWSAEVLQSHLAYPILNYFRSSHDDESWISALGAVLDAATLTITTLADVPHGHAKLMNQVGGHLVEDLAYYFGFAHEQSPVIHKTEFDQACDRLQDAGYKIRDRDTAWAEFSRVRGFYAIPLTQMATYLDIPPAEWVGDRSYVPSLGPYHT
jgi:hypothetical protein